MSSICCISAETWDRLIEAIGPASILVIINRRLGERLRRVTTADDILQNALLRTWQSRQDFEWRGIRRFRSWFLTIVDHCIRDEAEHYNAVKRGGAKQTTAFSAFHRGDGHHSDSFGFAGPVATTTPSRVAIYSEQATAMQRALDTLPEELGEIVRLRLFEQLTISAIANHLNLGESAVRHRFRKGAALYRQRLHFNIASQSVSNLQFAATPDDSDFAS